MRTKRAVVVAGVGLLLAAAPVWAHHAFSAEFDVNKPIKLQGTLAKWEMINPHSWFHIDVKGPDGKVVSLDDRRRQPEPAHQAGRDEEHPGRWNGADRRRLSGQGRHEQGRRQEFHARGRATGCFSAALPNASGGEVVPVVK